jgi:beta-carotene 15,15'-dioxygenase
LPFIEEKFVNFLGGFSVFTIGILHGANDLRIISKRFKNHIGNLYIKYLVLYALVVLIGGAFFFIAPSLSLLIFHDL